MPHHTAHICVIFSGVNTEHVLYMYHQRLTFSILYATRSELVRPVWFHIKVLSQILNLLVFFVALPSGETLVRKFSFKLEVVLREGKPEI